MKILCFTINDPQGHEAYDSYFNKKVFNIEDDFDLDDFIEKVVEKELENSNAFYYDASIEIWENGEKIKEINIDIVYKGFEIKFNITERKIGD